eukprot:6198229-Pleurochrysis_carterae.AAC.3
MVKREPITPPEPPIGSPQNPCLRAAVRKDAHAQSASTMSPRQRSRFWARERTATHQRATLQ